MSSWAPLGRPRAAPKRPRGPKTPPQRVLKGVQERPERVPRPFLSSSKEIFMRFFAKCKNLQKCCNVLQNSRSGASNFHQKTTSESILTTKIGPRETFLANFSATSPKNRSKSVRERPKVIRRGNFSPKYKTFCPPEHPKSPKRRFYKSALRF